MTKASAVEREMLALINEERASRGLSTLQLERNLNTAAEGHSEWMLRVDKFSHTGAGNSSATERIVDAGFDLSGSWRTGENIAVQSERGAAGISDDVVQLHNSLMNSPGHRANILNPDFDYVGIGIELGDFDFSSGTFRSVIVTQNFAATSGSVNLDTGGGAGTGTGGGAGGGTPTSPPPAPPADETPDTVLNGGAGNDRLRGTSRDETLNGLNGNDRLLGGKGDDQLNGGAGRDRLVGGDGDDQLDGGWAKDWLHGGRGNDTLKGGSGSDTFVFERNGDKDRITDFADNVDAINLRSFRLDTLAEARALATEQRGDVIFDFGNGDVLTVEDTSFAALQNDLLI